VVPEAIEGSLMLASHALALVGVPMRRVIRVVQDQRDARYGLLRGYFHGADDDTADERPAAPAAHRQPAARGRQRGAPAGPAGAGRPGRACGVGAGADGHVRAGEDDFVLSAGDTLVLSGRPKPGPGRSPAADRLSHGPCG
jgi:CPA2 family monovalent cation:H+ antiporter-2